MNQIKIGNFIAQCRKEKSITQQQLADKLYVSNRAVSKWENGKNLPDAAIMPDLCKILDITVNELFNGERLIKELQNVENYENKKFHLRK